MQNKFMQKARVVVPRKSCLKPVLLSDRNVGAGGNKIIKSISGEEGLSKLSMLLEK